MCNLARVQLTQAMNMAPPTLNHRSETVGGVTWHWVEAGDGDSVVLLHGIPESWQCWIHQIPTLATQFKVYAFDMKGYGQSDKAEGDYTMNNVALARFRQAERPHAQA